LLACVIVPGWDVSIKEGIHTITVRELLIAICEGSCDWHDKNLKIIGLMKFFKRPQDLVTIVTGRLGDETGGGYLAKMLGAILERNVTRVNTMLSMTVIYTQEFEFYA